MSRAAIGKRAAIAAVVLALAVFLVGGYGAGWGWTGLSGDVALWDWLEALALPLTVGLLPVIVLHRDKLQRRHRMALLVVLVVFVALVLAGYLVPWDWTGFTGNTLWDWLELALLPLVLATATFWPAPDELEGRHWAVLSVGAVVFLVVVLCGYLVPWGWTGFSDNKVWDWLQLLLLPVLVPTIVLPALQHFLEDGSADARAADGPRESVTS